MPNPITIIWWIKRDARLSDNQALFNAVQDADYVLPVFIVEPEIISADDYSAMHWHAQKTALEALQAELQTRQADVLFLQGQPAKVFAELYRNMPFAAIYAHQETGNMLTFQRDLAVLQFCKTHGIDNIEFHQNGVIRRLSDRSLRQEVINKRVLKRAPLAAVDLLQLPKQIEVMESAHSAYLTSLPEVAGIFSPTEYQSIAFVELPKVTEAAAQECLHSFLYNRGLGYSGGISSPNFAFHHGSRLSAHLAWGTLSLCQAYYASAQRLQELTGQNDSQSKQWRRSINAFRSRLHWHCHFIQRLETSPMMEFKPLNKAYDVIEYENDEQLLLAWQQGQTGFPLVDACMRCLQAIGFLNFRMRAFIVSFAVFGLHLDWRLIHPHLARVFYDYEPGIHLSQLQMQAAIVGINTMRVYNPTKQLIEQDSQCHFVKKWLPELRLESVENIQAYEVLPLPNYPLPVVDFAVRAKAMKAQISTVRRSALGKQESAKVLQKHGSRKRRKTRQQAVDERQISLF